MLLIARRQLMDGLRDAKFLFFATLVLVVFTANGFIYSDWYSKSIHDWNYASSNNLKVVQERADNLQELANHEQMMVKPPSALAFIADGGEQMLPNAFKVNAFYVGSVQKLSRDNKVLPVLGALDWSFIVGNLMTFVAALIGFGTICGEKRDGTLRLLLSYPISRIKLVTGKLIGLAFALIIVFLLGAAISLSILIFNGVLPLTPEVGYKIGWAVLTSVLCLLFALTVSVAVSALVHNPAVAMVIIMIGWVFFVFAIPGLARLIAEQSVEIKSKFEIQQEVNAAYDSIDQEIPASWKIWYGEPFHESVPNRAEWRRRTVAAMLKVIDDSLQKNINQAEVVNWLSIASPVGLLDSAFQELNGTGVHGFKQLLSATRRYRSQLYNFVKEIDSRDKETPHILYPYSRGDRGVISTKPVNVNSVPRYQELWLAGGLAPESDLPLTHLIILVLGILQAGIIALIAVARYDPR
ncbi:MAG TPA: ABC transporter permease subunit [Acidobacteriota bacterium]|nr:ABC transporter permease subunit [Acidobacteriota bacterium]